MKYEDPDAPEQRELLTAADAPHETAGILRLHRSGNPEKLLRKMFKLSGSELVRLIKLGRAAEKTAETNSLPIHRPVLPKWSK